MFSDRLRLNVGQVETLTLEPKGIWFLFESPISPNSPDVATRFEIEISDCPFYPAVPIPSGRCFVPSSRLASLPPAVRQAHDRYIRAAASFKRMSPFKQSWSPAILEHVERVLATALPRPSYLNSEAMDLRVDPLPDELDSSEPMIEGAQYQITVNAYERDPRARALCIAEHGSACVVCGFSFGTAFGSVAEGLIHVHHLRPLSELGSSHEVDPVGDLRPVCPNCHAVLHRRVPAFSIEEVRDFLLRQRGG